MFFPLLFLAVIILFKNAFFINFFIDDFFFLKIGKAHSFIDFWKFFWPVKSYFYRPIPTEFFYYLINSVKSNVLSAHLLVFVVYFVGLYFAYLSLLKLTNNKLLSKITIILYSLSFIHVFQLYQLATFIEIALFTFISISFYLFLEKKYFLSLLFFVFACMSKETSILFPVFLAAVVIFNKNVLPKKRMFFLYFLVSAIFAFIYKFGVGSVVAVSTYKIQLKPRLGINNLMWYSLWSLGLPNFMPDYFTSIFRKPIPDFWKVWKSNQIKTYFLLFSVYFTLLMSSLVIFLTKNKRNLKEFAIYLFISIFSFILFISPTLLIIHKWMVRLTLPLFFVSFIEAYLIVNLIKSGKKLRFLGYALIIIYIFSNVLAVAVHESSSTYLLESAISKNAKQYFEKNKKEIVKYHFIFFKDSNNVKYNPWGGSQKLKVTLSDQNFIDHFFPGADLKAVYGFESKTIPKDSYIVSSYDILLQR